MDIDQFGNVITEKNGKLQLITEKVSYLELLWHTDPVCKNNFEINGEYSIKYQKNFWETIKLILRMERINYAKIILISKKLEK